MMYQCTAVNVARHSMIAGIILGISSANDGVTSSLITRAHNQISGLLSKVKIMCRKILILVLPKVTRLVPCDCWRPGSSIHHQHCMYTNPESKIRKIYLRVRRTSYLLALRLFQMFKSPFFQNITTFIKHCFTLWISKLTGSLYLVNFVGLGCIAKVAITKPSQFLQVSGMTNCPGLKQCSDRVRCWSPWCPWGRISVTWVIISVWRNNV